MPYKNKEKRKSYYQKSEVKERLKKWYRERYKRDREKIRERRREIYKRDREKIRERAKEYYYVNREKRKIQMKLYRKMNIKNFKERDKVRYEKIMKNPELKEKYLEYKREYRKRLDVGERIRESQRKSYQKYREKKLKKSREYYNNPKIKRKKIEVGNLYRKNRIKIDKEYQILLRLRASLRGALKRYSKTGKNQKTSKYGINYNKIIESLKPFPHPIEDYHVDHIIPLEWFNLNDPKQIRWAFEPENLQWLPKNENIKKSNKYILIKEK